MRTPVIVRTTELQEVPEIPGMPELQEAPEIPGMPELPEVPGIPGTPEMQETPETLEQPQAQKQIRMGIMQVQAIQAEIMLIQPEIQKTPEQIQGIAKPQTRCLQKLQTEEQRSERFRLRTKMLREEEMGAWRRNG